MEVNKEKIWCILDFFFDKGENVKQAAEIVNGAYGADIVTANYEQFWFHRFRSGIFDVKVSPHPSQLSTTGPFEASDWPETARIGQQKRCCAPSGQRQATHFCSDSPETLGAWLRSVNASTI
ncbi:histone-lysine N-methyltransferase SETMAR [Trichonephila clavipes]|nr:histone-lysine N-methyltransferase SETMAR [Trichonephila clavipes]